MSEENKKIEVISDDGSTLNISPVYNHIKDMKPKSKNKKEDIVIPGKKKDKKEDSEN